MLCVKYINFNLIDINEYINVFYSFKFFWVLMKYDS